MTTIYHTPIINADPRKNDASIWNDPMGELDAQLSVLASQDTAFNDMLDAIIIDDGTGNAEVIAARTAIPYAVGSPPALLGDTIDYLAGGVANVLAYGADATGATDSSAAVQAAITANSAVYFPPGTYLVHAITVASDRTLYGNGATLKVNIASNFALQLQGSNIVVRDLAIAGVATTEYGIRLYMASNELENITIERCSFTNLAHGIRFAADWINKTAKKITIRNCRFEDLATMAIHMLQSGGTELYSLEDIRIEGNHFEDVAPNSSGKGSTGPFSAIVWVGGLTSVKRFYVCDNVVLRVGPQFFAVSNTANPRYDFVVSGNIVNQEGTAVICNMSYSLTSITNLIFSNNSCYYVDYEHCYMNSCKNFKISNCHFEKCNAGIAIVDNDVNYRSWGEISNCTFYDCECPSSENSGHKGIFISSDSAEVDISNCTFIKWSGTKGQNGIDTNYTNTAAGNLAKWSRVFNTTTDYTWTLDAGSRYYLRRTGAVNPGLPQPVNVYENPASGTTALVSGTLASLNAGEWAYGDNNGLGYKTIYVRLTGSGAPGNNAVSAGYPRFGININNCRFSRMSYSINCNSGGNTNYPGHAVVTSCTFTACFYGVRVVNSVGVLLAYNRFNGCTTDFYSVTELISMRACCNVHFNTNPSAVSFNGAYVIDIGTGYNIWEVSSCTFRNVSGVHVLQSGSTLSPRKRMAIFRDNDIDSLSTGLPNNIGAITAITSANKVLGHFDTAPAAGADWVAGDTIFNSGASDGETLGWVNVGASSSNSRPIQAQTYYRVGSVAPSVSATFIGEEFLDNVANKWYKAKATGTGASDWVALN